MNRVNITGVMNGWIVKVGCQKVVFTDLEHMLIELRRYIQEPKEGEKEYFQNSKNTDNNDFVVEISLSPDPESTEPG